MNRYYLRYLLLVLLGLSAAVWIADQVYLGQQQKTTAQEPVEISLRQLLDALCEKNTCTPTAMNHRGHFSILSKDQLLLPASELDLLNRGGLVRAENEAGSQLLYLQAGDHIAQFGPFEDELVGMHQWYTRFFYLLLGVAIVVCLWPLIRDLQKLKDAAARFARDRNPAHFHFSHSSFFTPVSDAMVWMSQRLARAVALQQELSATLSHELRTPITRLRFLVASLPHESDANLKREIQEDLDELDALVDEYLTFARQEHERPLLDFGPVNLLDLISPRFQQVAHISGRRAQLDVASLVVAEADRRSLVRVFNNLIDNGVKYSASVVHIRLYLEDGDAVFVIEDDGPGLAGIDFEDLFLPYARESGVQELPGYGLGLAIVRKVVDWHSGSISAGASTTFGGARFELRLPAAAAREADVELLATGTAPR
ncbi:HAMP domain-containing histidine kinase [Microbulbifer elongatus]|uniref:histidine kinase n=1 Tax=Microbulbifer elongatus TaxID=86173 RepID=A0ABT1NW96_9GAMM|nr:HAMP domain-containing histidine kinase [Microbulbifer elongatus]